MDSKPRIRTNLLLVPLFFMLLVSNVQAQTARTYAEAIKKGQQELQQGKLIDAKAYYQMALRLKPGDSTAQAKITLIIGKLKKEGARKEVYYQWVDQGDAYLDSDALDAAMEAYNKALQIIPNDAYAESKIKEILHRKQIEKDKLQAYHDFIQKGDELLKRNQFSPALFAFRKADTLFPKREVPKSKIALTLKLQKEYQKKTKEAGQFIAKAKKFLVINDFVSALTALRSADSLIPGNTALQARIGQIEPLAAKQKAYDQKIKMADQLYLSKNFMAAKMQYEQANKLWPQKTYPGEMIGRIDARLQQQRAHLEANYRLAVQHADSLFNLSEWENAKAEYNLALNLKPDAAYPKNQIKAIEAALLAHKEQQKAQYAGIIRQADSLFNKTQYLASQPLYHQALTIRPEDRYPAQKLKEITAKLAEQAAAEKRNAQYQSLIESGDSLFRSKNWTPAMSDYTKALQIKPEANYPETQISAIREAMANAKKQEETNAQYAVQMQKGQVLMGQSQWNDAKSAFQQALALKPTETEPKTLIHHIDSIQQQLARQQQIDSAYNKVFATGINQMNQKDYERALASFEQAQKLKPTEPAPGQKITAIRDLLAEQQRMEALNNKYRGIISQADTLFKQKSYEMAVQQYQEALKLKPEAQYPQNRITIIKALLVQLEKEKEQRYTAAISQGDSLFKVTNYKSALKAYQTAKSIKPDASYPLQQIAQCRSQIKTQEQQLLKQYRQVMGEADQFYAGKIFDKAIASYKKAHEIKPDESRPLEMVQKITKYIEEHAVEDITNQTMVINANQRKTFKFKPVNVTVRNENYVLVKARNMTGKAFNVLFTYGKDGERNGGFVINVPAGKASHDFIIRVGTQYKWFSEDNNWLSVYPENNDLEIKLIRISKTD